MKKFINSVPAAYQAQVLSLGGSAALTFITAFFLEASDRGTLAIFLTISAIAGYLICFGTQSQILQLTANGKISRSKILILGQIPIQVASTSALFFFLQITKIFPTFDLFITVAVCLSVLFGGLFNNFSWAQYGSDNFVTSTSLRGLIPLGALVCTFIYGIVSDFDVRVTIATYILFQLIGLLVISTRLPWSTPMSVTFRQVLRSYRKSVGYFMTQGFVQILSRSPVLAAGLWMGPTTTAVVAIALSITELQSSLPQMRSAMTFQEASKTGQLRLSWPFIRHAIFALLPGAAIVIAISFAARWILSEEYENLPLFVAIFTFGIASQAIAASAINIMTLRKSLNGTIAVLVISIIAGFLAIFYGSLHGIVAGLMMWSMAVGLAGAVLIIIACRKPALRVDVSCLEVSQ